MTKHQHWLLACLFLGGFFSSAEATTMPNAFFLSGPQAERESAIRANDLRSIAQSLRDGATVHAAGIHGATPLMIAVDAQCFDAVGALLKAGAEPNAKALDGNGPVSLAVKSYLAKPHGRDIMIAIFRGGGDPNTRRPDGDPVLMQFIFDHDVADLKLMQALGANLNISDRGGDPLITNVAMSQDWDLVW